MCGLLGCWALGGMSVEEAQNVAKKLADTLQHRGPDKQSWVFEEKASLLLLHTRLSILELSPAGDQPMNSHSGRYTIVFNGEIYNHQQLRACIKNERVDIPWRGDSDTETLLACFDVFGFEATLKKINGMFALALYDRVLNDVFIARDHAGEKPLYFGKQGQNIFFASELKGIVQNPLFASEIDEEALAAFFQFGYVPTPFSIYKNIKKLPPASWVRLSLPEETNTYWSITQERTKSEKRFELDNRSTLDDLLRDAVAKQMQADVSVGAFLSGGVDSSLIVSLMQEQSLNKINTFTIGFKDERFNEASLPQVACHLGTTMRSITSLQMTLVT